MALSNTAYDDQGKPPCDEDTRVGVLADIKRWVDDVSSGSVAVEFELTRQLARADRRVGQLDTPSRVELQLAS